MHIIGVGAVAISSGCSISSAWVRVINRYTVCHCLLYDNIALLPAPGHNATAMSQNSIDCSPCHSSDQVGALRWSHANKPITELARNVRYGLSGNEGWQIRSVATSLQRWKVARTNAGTDSPDNKDRYSTLCVASQDKKDKRERHVTWLTLGRPCSRQMRLHSACCRQKTDERTNRQTDKQTDEQTRHVTWLTFSRHVVSICLGMSQLIFVI